MACNFDCSFVDYNRTDCVYWGTGRLSQCGNFSSEFENYYVVNNCTEELGVNLERGLTAVLIFIVSLIGNVCTIALLSRFKIHKIPDVLVIGLAITDLVAAFIPVPLSIYAYFSGYRFIQGNWLCDLYATVAHFTRYASVLIVTIVSVERYLAVIHPFFYRKHATPKKVAYILVLCWLVAFALAVAPALDRCTSNLPHEGFCLFDIGSDYAYSILVYGGIQYVIVLFCFVAVTVQLCLVYRRRKKLKVQGKRNKQSNAQERQHEVKFVKPNLTSRISDLSKSLRKAAPAMAEKFHFGVEAQFAGMLFAVVILFYLSWTAILALIVIAHAQNTGSGLEEALFWGIRLSVISTAINPLMYGFLARQYRLAYWYVIKVVLSKCCRCVSPPLKDVFAAARAPGGDIRSETSVAGNRRKRFLQNGSVGRSSMPESYWSRGTSGAILTATTHVTHPNDLEAIDEADFEYNPDSVMEEHSTFIQSAGELASSVIIPHQARDKNSSETDLTRTKNNTLRATASLDNLGDGLMVDFGCSQDPQQGVKNPMVNVLGEGESISPSSEENSTVGEAFQIGRLYNNPVYQIEVARRQKENQSRNISSLVAASSADDITLVSNTPLHPPPPPISNLVTATTDASTLRPQENHTHTVASHTLPHISHSGTALTAKKDMKEEGKASNKRPVDPRLERMKRLQPKVISRSQEFDITSAEVDNRRNSLNFEPVTNGVHPVRMRYEAPTTPTTPTSPPTRLPPSQINGKSGRCNSVGNSDSGRESMVLETDV